MTISELRKKVAQLCRARNIIGFEPGVSLPIPLVFAGEVSYQFITYVSLFRPDEKKSYILHPSRVVVVDPETLEIKNVRNYSMTGEAKSIGTHTITDEFLAANKTDMPTLITEFDALYEKAMLSYIEFEKTGTPMSLTQEEKDRLRQLFRVMVPNCLIQFYDDMGAYFFNLLDIYPLKEPSL